MSGITGAAAKVGRTRRGLLPSGQLLTPEVWARRHRGIVWLLWLHVAAIAAFAVARGNGLGHGLEEASLVALFALPAAHPAIGRRARSAAAVLGLITSSAVIVHLSGGVVEAHFHFFVMVGVITLYQDWLPFGLALGYVVVHHTVLGLVTPTDVFNHPAALRAPWKWALIHGGFVLAASVAYLANWRLSEHQAIEISRHRLAGRGPLHRPAGAVRRGGVRAPAAGVRPGRRHPHRGAAADRHPPGHLLGRAGPLDFQEGGAELIQRADQALYTAKAEGRNRHVLAS